MRNQIPHAAKRRPLWHARVCCNALAAMLTVTSAMASPDQSQTPLNDRARDIQLLQRFGEDPRFRKHVPELGLSFALPPSSQSEGGVGTGWGKIPEQGVDAVLRGINVAIWPLPVAKRPRAVYGLFAAQVPSRLIACILVYSSDGDVAAADFGDLAETIQRAFPASTVHYDTAAGRVRGIYRFGESDTAPAHSEYIDIMRGNQGFVALIGVNSPAADSPFAEIFATASVAPDASSAPP